MGILSNLFKQKSANPKAAQAEGRPGSALSAFSSRTKETAATEEESDETPAADETADIPAKNIFLGGHKRNTAETPEAAPADSKAESRKNIAISGGPAQVGGMQPRSRSLVPVKTAEVSDKPISVDLDDVLPQIPRDLLNTGRGNGGKKSLSFSSYELLPGLSQGKAAVPVSRIAGLAPELFNDRPIPADAVVELPLQKIAAQVAVFPGRPDQVDEVYPPLDARHANLVVEKGGKASAAQEPVVAVETAAAKPAVEKPVAVESVVPSPAVVEKMEAPAPAAEIATNGTAEIHAEKQPAAETVSYSLAAILPNVPQAWLVNGKSKTIDPSARITLPFELIEAQLASGRVELPFEHFRQALPENLKEHFSDGKDVPAAGKVVIPLNEVFLNLPGVEPLPPLPAKPAPVEPEPAAAAKVETPEPAPAEAQVEAKVEAQPESAKEIAPEEKKPEEASPAREPEPVVAEAIPEPVISPVAAVEEPVAKVEEPETKAEPPAPVDPEPAAVVEPQPVEVAPEPTPIPEPSKEEVADPVVIEAAAPEPPQSETTPVETPKAPAGMQFITPSIQIQRLAPPPIITTAASAAREPEPPAPSTAPAEIVEVAKTPAPVEAAAPAKPAPATPAEPAAPASEPVATAVKPVAKEKPPLTELIATDGKFDARKTLEHTILLPGITAATLTIKGKSKAAGEIPAGFHAYETGKALFQSLESPAKGAAAAAASAPRAITAHHDHFSSTWFKQNGIMLCVVHPARSLEEEAHHAVHLVVQEIVRLRQH